MASFRRLSTRAQDSVGRCQGNDVQCTVPLAIGSNLSILLNTYYIHKRPLAPRNSNLFQPKNC